MALYHFRTQNYPATLEWRNRCFASPKVSRVCATAVRAIAAMASFQLGQPGEARAELAKAQDDCGKPASAADFKNTWWDWIIARILVREAEAMMAAGEPQK